MVNDPNRPCNSYSPARLIPWTKRRKRVLQQIAELMRDPKVPHKFVFVED